MTKDKLVQNPPFNLGRRLGTVTAPPPFSFSDVVMRFFPLKADFLALTQFCDQYLNLAPEFAYFRPSMPFVLLTVVNYGRMSMEAGNLGWTSQNEVLFSIPLEWYEPKDGELVFKDMAQVAPFIFVDDEASQVGGREVYGWPKVQGWFGSGVDSWAVDPRAPRHLLHLETRVFEDLYAGKRPKPREILAIEEDPAASFTVIPPDPMNPLNPMVSFPRAISAWSDLFQSAVEMMTTPAIRGYKAIDRRTMPNLMASARDSMDVFTKNLQANTINLKQFRDAADPTQACYQALTNARMEISQFHRGGMLGDFSLLQGDPSGGHRVLLSRYDSIPIINTLGLEVTSETQGEGPPIASLTPIFPFWQEVDLRYQMGENLCWRSRDRHWRNAEREGTPDETDKTAAFDEVEVRHEYNNTSSSGTQVAIGPFRFPEATVRIVPLQADHEDLQAMVDRRLNEGVGVDPVDPVRERVGRFEAVGSTVYLTVQSFGEMASETNNIGPWADKRVDFAIPVRRDDGTNQDFGVEQFLGMLIVFGELNGFRQQAKDAQEKLTSAQLDLPAERAKAEEELEKAKSAVNEQEAMLRVVTTKLRENIESGTFRFMGSDMDGFFSPFMFAAGGIATSTGREVNGWDTIEAEIASPESVWLRDAFSPPRPVLNLSTQVFPALGVGQKSQWRTLFEIREAESAPGDPSVGLGSGGEDMLKVLKMLSGNFDELALGEGDELMQKEAEEIMGLLRTLGPAILDQFSLKQFRDAADPESACYQSIVRCPMSIEQFHDQIRVIKNRVQVRIHRYPNHPIVDDLGLVVQSEEITEDGCNIACLTPAEGYYVKVDLRADLAENLCTRSGTMAWSGPTAPSEAKTENKSA